jgi:membrane protease YdiL (CAAX protease family)
MFKIKNKLNFWIKMAVTLRLFIVFAINFLGAEEATDFTIRNANIPVLIFDAFTLVFVAPIVETILWQSWLMKPDAEKKINYDKYFIVGIIFSILGFTFTAKTKYLFTNSLYSVLIECIFYISIYLIYLLVDKILNTNQFLNKKLDILMNLIRKNIFVAILFSTTISTAGHQLFEKGSGLPFFVVLTYYLIGFFLYSAVRIRFGLIAAIIVHSMHNSLIIVNNSYDYNKIEFLDYFYSSFLIVLVIEIILLFNLKKVGKIINLQ